VRHEKFTLFKDTISRELTARHQAQTIDIDKLCSRQELFFKFKGTPSQDDYKTRTRRLNTKRIGLVLTG
jgi:hypothetical protein